MDEILENWNKHFVTECFFDTVLIKNLLGTTKNLHHKKGCNIVVNELRKGSLKNCFAVAIVDKDKRELDYLMECYLLRHTEGFLLWKHTSNPHFIIQLYPPLENWIKLVLDEAKISIRGLGFSDDPRQLKKAIKFEIDSERNERLMILIGAIVKCKVERVEILRRVLNYLKIMNYQVDLNELKNV